MQLDVLKQTILDKGVILNGEMLKVDSFLNHQIDPVLMDKIACSFADEFRELNINRIITIESGGIAPALMAASRLGVPLVFCKKTTPKTMRDPLYATVHSYTKNTDSTICMERDLIQPGDRVLFIDDFLANGQAFLGIQKLVQQSGATLVGAGFCIEKAWQSGHDIVEKTGIPWCSLVRIQSIKDGQIEFT